VIFNILPVHELQQFNSRNGHIVLHVWQVGQDHVTVQVWIYLCYCLKSYENKTAIEKRWWNQHWVIATCSKKMSERNLEQRINIKFCAKLGKSARETLDMLRVAYGDNALKKSIVFEWLERFKEGWERVKPRQPKTQQSCENLEKVKQLVQSDRRLCVQMMAEELNLNTETVR
jgi:hypothetical protein